MKQRVYIETTIPSFFFEPRPEPEMVARRNWTVAWWLDQRSHYELVTSAAVLEELGRGRHSSRDECLHLMAGLPLLPTSEEVDRIVETYVRHQLMPRDPTGDALHLAIASYHRCQFLLTWNCVHLANANKVEHIRHLNSLLGLPVPVLTTPAELLYWQGVDDEA